MVGQIKDMAGVVNQRYSILDWTADCKFELIMPIVANQGSTSLI